MTDAHQRNTILLSSYAKLPSSTTAEAVYDILVLAVLFDNRKRIMVQAETYIVTELVKNLVTTIIVGYKLYDGP